MKLSILTSNNITILASSRLIIIHESIPIRTLLLAAVDSTRGIIIKNQGFSSTTFPTNIRAVTPQAYKK